MGFERVKLFQFRNLENGELVFSGSDNYLVGENGQGKTNFLESIYLLCVGSSFRTRKESSLIKHSYDAMQISAVFNDGYQHRSLQIRIDGGKKTIVIDGKQIRDRKELISDFPCIAFIHDDISYVNGSPGSRRMFIDQTISLYDSSYIDALRNYNRLVKSRNRVLKDGRHDLLALYDSQICESGAVIMNKRRELISSFNNTFTDLYEKISDTRIRLSIKYGPSWKAVTDAEGASECLQISRRRDIQYRTTSTGPHRDKIGFFADGINFAETASTGQVRLISLALKAAQASFTAEKSGRKPVLLLDDVLLEMDLEKRKRFLDNLPPYRQAFFTFLPDENLVDYRQAGHYHVHRGRISRKES